MKAAQSCPNLCDLTAWTIHSMEFSRIEYWSGEPFPSPGCLPNPGIKARSPTLQADSLPAEPPGKPKNTGVSSLSLLHGVFLTQESNWGFLHCRQILQQLSYDWFASVSHCGLGILMNDSRVQETICFALHSFLQDLHWSLHYYRWELLKTLQ